MSERYISRGKRTDNGKWREGYLSKSRDENKQLKLCIDYEEKGVMCSSIVIPETIGQCTGLEDKNGKLIYEGDLLRFTNSDNEQSIYKVFYDDVYAGYRIQKIGLGGLDEMSNWEDSREYFEVIGNIHDNIDLLKGE